MDCGLEKKNNSVGEVVENRRYGGRSEGEKRGLKSQKKKEIFAKSFGTSS